MNQHWYLYQRALWYANVGINELRKPLQFQNETAQILLFLGVYGLTKDWLTAILWAILGNLIVYVIMIVIGVIIVRSGSVRYTQTLGNTQNAELLEVVERMRRLEGNFNVFVREMREKIIKK